MLRQIFCVKIGQNGYQNAELGISLFEIAQPLFALERTFILGAMALLETKSELTKSNFERSAHERYKDKRAP